MKLREILKSVRFSQILPLVSFSILFIESLFNTGLRLLNPYYFFGLLLTFSPEFYMIYHNSKENGKLVIRKSQIFTLLLFAVCIFCEFRFM